MNRRALAALATACAFSLAVPALTQAYRARANAPFAGVVLVDQTGKRFTLEAFRGKRVMLGFATVADGAAGACASVSGKFAYLQRRIDPRRLRLLQVSADPERDSAPGVLASYARTYGIDPERWSVAGGAAGDVSRADARLVEAARGAGITDVFGSAVAVIDERGALRAVLDSGALSPDALVRAALRR